jgi:hypothetical protein
LEGSQLTISGKGTVMVHCVNRFIIPIGEGAMHTSSNYPTESVIIENGVEVVGPWAFHDHADISFVSLPSSLSIIKDNAFRELENLRSIDFPNSLQEIGSEAFRESGLVRVRIPSSIVLVGHGAFTQCPITEFIVSADNPSYLVNDGVLYTKDRATLLVYPLANQATVFESPTETTRIEAEAMADCMNLLRIDLRNVISIGEQGLANCQDLVQLNLPETLLHLEAKSLSLLVCLQTIYLPNSLKTIGAECFADCTALRFLELPDSVISSGASFVAYCQQLTELWLGSSLVEIGPVPSASSYRPGAFYMCARLNYIFLPDSIERLYPSVLCGSYLESISVSGKIAGIPQGIFIGDYYSAILLESIHVRGPVDSSSLCDALKHVPTGTTIYASSVSGTTLCDAILVQPKPSESIRPTRRPPPTRLAPRSPTEAELPTLPRSPFPTPRPEVTPLHISVADGGKVDPDKIDPSVPIVIGGTGFLDPGNQQLWLTSVTLNKSADVIASHLVVQSSLQLSSGSSLQASPNDKIQLEDNIVLEFNSDTVDSLPSLNLGDIGPDYSVTPFTVVIQIEDWTRFSEDLHRELVAGRTLKNCEEWRKAVTGLPGNFDTKCDPIPNSGQSLQSGGDAIGLFVVKGGAKGDGDGDGDRGLGGGAIAGIVIGVVAVVGIGVALVWFLVVKKGGDDSVDDAAV